LNLARQVLISIKSSKLIPKPYSAHLGTWHKFIAKSPKNLKHGARTLAMKAYLLPSAAMVILTLIRQCDVIKGMSKKEINDDKLDAILRAVKASLEK
jgi:hypothetical protein